MYFAWQDFYSRNVYSPSLFSSKSDDSLSKEKSAWFWPAFAMFNVFSFVLSFNFSVLQTWCSKSHLSEIVWFQLDEKKGMFIWHWPEKKPFCTKPTKIGQNGNCFHIVHPKYFWKVDRSMSLVYCLDMWLEMVQYHFCQRYRLWVDFLLFFFAFQLKQHPICKKIFSQ